MLKTTLAASGTVVTDKTIDSKSLLEMVNAARKECGEKPVRNNVFIGRIKDELEGEGYKTFVTPMDKEKGGADQVRIEMSIKQALRVAARESKAVRRSLVDKLESMSQQSFDPMAALNDPVFLRNALLEYSEKVQVLEVENKGLSHKVESMENLFKEGMTPTQFCKMLNGVNVMMIGRFLEGRKWLYNESKSSTRWRSASYARDKYLTEHQITISVHGGEDFVKYTPVLLHKGAVRIYQLYLKGELPMKANWNGDYTHDKQMII